MAHSVIRLNKPNNSIGIINDSIRQGVPTAIFGVVEEFKKVIVSELDAPVLIITSDVINAKSLANSIQEYSDKRVVVIPPKDETLVMRKAFSKDSSFERIVAISKIKDSDVVILPIEALMQTFPAEVQTFVVEKDGEYDRDALIKKLVSMGYKRVETVNAKSTFSLKGDMLEIYPVNSANPYHIDFFMDTVESIKEFDLENRKSLGFVKDVYICQAVEIILSELDGRRLLSMMESEISKCSNSSFTRLSQIKSDVQIALENKSYDELSFFGGMSEGAVYIDELISTNTVILFDEPKKLHGIATSLEREFNERFNDLYKGGETFLFAKRAFLPTEEIAPMLERNLFMGMQTLTSTLEFFYPLKIVNVKANKVADYKLDLKEFFNDAKNWLSTGYKVLVATGDAVKRDKLLDELFQNGLPRANCDTFREGVVAVSDKKLDYGFIFHEEKLVVIGSGNLYVKKQTTARYKPKKQNFFTAPEPGDYAVHEVHGVGKVLGVKRISSTEGTKDYVSVEYKGGDVLYIPVEQLDVLTRYLGGDKTPSLSKIGGQDFDRVKERIKSSIKKMSFDLKKLYEERNSRVGFKFELDEELMTEFINAFHFEDTFDQATTTKEILDDMSSGKVMDRLVCGDVGFGKTEMAFRAVFLSVVNGKQAVLLAPTTILTEQHYNTAVERFKGFGIKIACLNRFRTEKQQEEILQGLKDGSIDFVIGTHKLLGKGVQFKDLGLLVLDEEQRFGVEHKEKIKLLKSNVDTLTLTATPIPRTLHMSLSGIRPISTINTPPKKRLPVQTYVTEETDLLIKDAVLREINRGGQCFILYNRVETIHNFAAHIRELLPGVKTTVAHGRMEERALENGIMEFYSGESQLLISTTIIENGIDLPKANTLIVIDADKLGLSTLYQLKGRVGRSDRLAYAYFTFKREKVLTETAFQRLNAIVEFAEMGSGIKIAMRDLEIRGAGNVLGKEQHGHMDKIGYELYAKLLKEEIDGVESVPLEIDIRVTSYIPENYIESSSARMSAYKDIAEIDGDLAEKEVREGLEFTFGKIPEETDNLINIALTKVYAKKFNITSVVISKEEVSLTFSSLQAFKDGALMKACEKLNGRAVFSVKEAPMIEFRLGKLSGAERLLLIKSFLQYAIKHSK